MCRTPRNYEPLFVGVAIAALLLVGVSQPVLAAGREPRLNVVYAAPRLSIEARGVSVSEVLREIGEKVGFTVVDMSVSRRELTLSIEDATLEEVLRQLLRGENHALVYRGQGAGKPGGGIETVLLLGPPTSRGQVHARGERRPELKHPAAISGSRGDAVEASRVDQPMPPLSGAWGRERRGIENEDDTEFKAADLLRMHAFHGQQPSETLAGHHADRPLRERLATPAPVAVGETLAITTRLAQQNLQVLMDGLAIATSSLLGSSGDQGR